MTITQSFICLQMFFFSWKIQSIIYSNFKPFQHHLPSFYSVRLIQNTKRFVLQSIFANREINRSLQTTYLLLVASMDELLGKSDFVLACCALNSETKGNSVILNSIFSIFIFLQELERVSSVKLSYCSRSWSVPPICL